MFGGRRNDKKEQESLSKALAPENAPKNKSGGGSGSLTGFDPEGLERAAKAARELDASRNASSAIELIKTQEVTKQVCNCMHEKGLGYDYYWRYTYLVVIMEWNGNNQPTTYSLTHSLMLTNYCMYVYYYSMKPRPNVPKWMRIRNNNELPILKMRPNKHEKLWMRKPNMNDIVRIIRTSSIENDKWTC
jgi:hypothetical protein